MPIPGTPSGHSFDGAHLVLSKRPVKRSSSCLHITTLQIPSLENTGFGETLNKNCNTFSASNMINSNDRAIIKRPKKIANVQTGTNPNVKGERELSLATKQKADDKLYLRKRNDEKHGVSLVSSGKRSQTSTNRGKNVLSVSETIVTADHMLGDELMGSKLRAGKNSDCNFAKLQGLHKNVIEAWTSIDHGVLSGPERRFDNGPGFKKHSSRKMVEDDGLQSFSNSSPGRTTCFEGAGSTLTSENTAVNLLKFESSSYGRKDGHIHEPKEMDYGMHLRDANLASQKPLQRAANRGMSARISPQSLSQLRQSIHHTGSLPSGGESAQQQSYTFKTFKEFQGTSTTKWEPICSISSKPSLPMNYAKSLIKTLVSMLGIFLKKIGFDVASLETITRKTLFVEGSFSIKFRSQIAVLISIVCIVALLCYYLTSLSPFSMT
ncbi:hypothetical protein L7F22_031956 [Adiantum nelumboides]|nr:hypothetical protein [Adiantum nelumboides]